MADAYNIAVDENDEKVTLEVEADNVNFPGHETPHDFITFSLDGETVYYVESYKVEQIVPEFGDETRVEEVNRVPQNNGLGGL